MWDRKALDLTQPERFADRLEAQRPDVVVNAAAYTAVDRAESEPDLAQLINATAVTGLARATEALGIPFIHLSTDYVFDGEANRPYSETDAPAPRSVYGQTKLAGENGVQQSCERFWIFRTSWVFSEFGGNFVATMLRLGRERDHLRIVDDQWGRPSYAGDVAWVIAEFIRRWQSGDAPPWGIYHAASTGTTTWCRFARAIFSACVETGVLRKVPSVDPISTDLHPTPAVRPLRAILDTGRLEGVIGVPLPHWRQGLARVLNAAHEDL